MVILCIFAQKIDIISEKRGREVSKLAEWMDGARGGWWAYVIWVIEGAPPPGEQEKLVLSRGLLGFTRCQGEIRKLEQN